MYNATSYHHSYEDTGLLCIHASADPRQVRAGPPSLRERGDESCRAEITLSRSTLSYRFEKWWKSSRESLF